MLPKISVLFFAPSRERLRALAWPVRALNFALALLLIGAVIFVSFRHADLHWHWDLVAKYWRLFADGWRTTVAISAVSLGLSTLIGLVFALARRARFLPLRYFAKIYVELIRGTPLLVQILIFFYIVGEAIGIRDFRLGEWLGFHDENLRESLVIQARYVVGVLTLSIFAGAYIAEVIRAGIESVGQSQLESAMAIGLTRAQTYRYVIFPQALRQVLPPLAGQFVSLIKDSSLLSIIGLNEFTQNAKNVASYTFSNFESYLLLAAGYLVLTLPISLWTRWLEARVKYET
jgi:polar amino acid transport system permease protein